MSDSYRYERDIREALTEEEIRSTIETIDREIDRLKALKPIGEARIKYIAGNIRHYYRVTVYYHDSKRPAVYRPSKYDPEIGRWIRDYTNPEKTGAHYSVRVDHRVYDNNILFSDYYDQGQSLSFHYKDKAGVKEYVKYLTALYGLTIYPREELIKKDPEIRNYSIKCGSVWYYWLPAGAPVREA